MDRVKEIYSTFLGSDVLIAPQYLLAALAVVWVIWWVRKPGDGFWAWALPRRIWTHRSTRLDVELFLLNRVMTLVGLLAKFAMTPVIAGFIAGLIPPVWPSLAVSPIWLALVLWLTADLSLYVTHRVYHQSFTLWQLHAVHHSAEVLTPVTTYRQHPLGLLVSTALQSLIIGTILGLLIGVLDPEASFARIAGINAFILLTFYCNAVLHHSHIWLSYGPVLERIFISPAQHQIHHSTDPAHFNRNYGNFLAIWDWAFGTLYVIRGPEDLQFGLDRAEHAALMEHRFGSTMSEPLRRMVPGHKRAPAED